MTVVSRTVSGSTGEVLKIGLSEGSPIFLKIPYLPDEHRDLVRCFPGQELSPPEEAALRFAAACYRAERAALRLVARAEQNRRGISLKLRRRGCPGPTAAAVVSRLTSLEILSDERYAARWLRSRLARSAESPFRLFAALRRRGIAAAVAQDALHTLLDLETEAALLERYLRKRCPPSVRSGSGLWRVLKREGFSAPVLERLREEADGAAEGEA